MMNQPHELVHYLQKKRKHLPSLSRLISGKGLFILIFLVLFTVSVFLFARFEFLKEPVYSQLRQEGKSPYFEALYWLVTTAATVGYGDITPKTVQGKILAIIVMILGVSLLGFLLSKLTQGIVESNIGRLFGVNRIKKSIDHIICGWNEISKAAFEQINDLQRTIIIIDEKRPDIDFSENVLYLKGNPSDKVALQNANVEKGRNILLCMEDDADNVLAIHLVRELSPWINITARINDPDIIPMAESAGADQVVSPAAIAGRLLSLASTQPYLVKWFLQGTSLHQNFVEYAVHPKSMFIGKNLAMLRQLHNVRVIGVESADGFEKIPHEAYTVKAGDRLVVMLDKVEA